MYVAKIWWKRPKTKVINVKFLTKYFTKILREYLLGLTSNWTGETITTTGVILDHKMCKVDKWHCRFTLHCISKLLSSSSLILIQHKLQVKHKLKIKRSIFSTFFTCFLSNVTKNIYEKLFTLIILLAFYCKLK